MQKFYKILQILILVIFSGLISLPLINAAIKLIPEATSNENRTKAEFPEISEFRIPTYTKLLGDYYADNFSLRENYIKLLNKLNYHFFSVSPFPDKVIIGHDGWIYAKKSAKNYTGKAIFTQYELKELEDELLNRTAWAKEHGIQYYVAVVPNKMNIYPEHLPSKIIKKTNQSYYEQVIGLKQPGINIINIKENILSHKNNGQTLYQKTDDHWNSLGAYYGYEAISNTISQNIPMVYPIPLDSFQIITEEREGNLARLIDVSEEEPEQFLQLVPKFNSVVVDGEKHGYPVPAGIDAYEYEIVKENKNVSDLKCLIIRDSFSLLLIKYLQEHFSKTVLIHDEWKYRMREDIIKMEKPDVVINIILETELHKLLEYPFSITVRSYYNRLAKSEKSFASIREKAAKNKITIEKMLMLDALWLFHNTKDKNKRKNIDYYRFLYATQDSLSSEVNQLSESMDFSIEESIDSCAQKAYFRNRVESTY